MNNNIYRGYFRSWDELPLDPTGARCIYIYLCCMHTMWQRTKRQLNDRASLSTKKEAANDKIRRGVKNTEAMRPSSHFVVMKPPGVCNGDGVRMQNREGHTTSHHFVRQSVWSRIIQGNHRYHLVSFGDLPRQLDTYRSLSDGRSFFGHEDSMLWMLRQMAPIKQSNRQCHYAWQRKLPEESLCQL